MKTPSATSPIVLSDDLLFDVLSFLSVKSLTQLRCVCKSWNSLISHPTFIKSHFIRSKRNPHITLFSKSRNNRFDNSVIPFPLTRLLNNPPITIPHDPHYQLSNKHCCFIVGCCNGLLCLLRHSFNLNPEESTFTARLVFRLWNPATNTLSNKIKIHCRKFINPPFGFIKYHFSFGYDYSTHIYKGVVYFTQGTGTMVKVFDLSLGDNVGRYIQDFPVVPLRYKPTRFGVNDGVFVSGTLNWLAIRNKLKYDWTFNITIHQFVIISLDLGTETFHQLLPPRGFDKVPHVEPSISVLMDCLCFSHNIDEKYFVIWQMKEFGVEESWIQLLKISYVSLRNVFGPKMCVTEWVFYCRNMFMYPLCFSQNGDTLILACDNETQAILYNLRDNSVVKTRITNEIHWFRTKDYAESLVPTHWN